MSSGEHCPATPLLPDFAHVYDMGSNDGFCDRHTSDPEVDPDGIPYMVMRPESTAQMVSQLGNTILAAHQKEPYDSVVYMLRGGYFVGEPIARKLDIPAYPIGVRVYTGVEAKGEAASREVRMYQSLPKGIQLGRRVLLLDEVNDTSTTKQGVTGELFRAHDIHELDYGVMHEKPANRAEEADFVGDEFDGWIVYDWEHNGSFLHKKWEFFEEKFPIWMMRRDAKEQIRLSACLERSLAIGFHRGELPNLEEYDFNQRLKRSCQKRLGALGLEGMSPAVFDQWYSAMVRF